MLTCTYESPVGRLTLAAEGDALAGLWLEDQKYYGATLIPGHRPGQAPVLDEACRWLDAYFARQRPQWRPRLAPQGSAFRQVVWQLLCTIGYGQTVTYGQLAQQVAQRLGRAGMSAQAVGGAVGHDPISIIIPCHRVVGADGSLTGYAGGVAAKQRLLQLEGADLAGLYVPTRGTAL